MKWFEKEYKDRFANETTLEGVDSSKLWSQISSAIPEEEITSQPTYWRWIMLVFAVLGLVALGVFLNDSDRHIKDFASESKTSTQVDKYPKKEMGVENEMAKVEQMNSKREEEFESKIVHQNSNDNIIIENNEDLKSYSKINDKVVGIRATAISSDGIIEKDELENNRPFKQTVAKNPETEMYVSNPLLSKQTFFEEVSEIGSSKLSHDETEKVGDIISRDPNMSVLVNTELENASIEREPVRLGNIELPRLSSLENHRYIDMPAISPSAISVMALSPWSFGIYSNANLFKLKYQDDVHPEKFADQANSSLGPLQLGNTFGVHLDYQLNRNWFIRAGLEMNNYENKLSTIIVTDTTVFDSNNILRRAQNIWTVTKHNKLSSYSIPISLGYEHHLAKGWSIGASVGLSYSIIQSQNGRLLGRNDSILDYSDEDNTQFNSFMSFRINPFIRYHLSNRMSMNINGGLSFQSHGKAAAQELSHSSTIYSFGLGLKYHL